jgi:hypothetical protein
MAKPKKLIASECFGDVMDAVAAEVKKIIDTPPDEATRDAFLTYFNTLLDVVDLVFDYLPKGDRSDIRNLCATWMDVGILLGKSPQLLTEILVRTGAKISEKEPGAMS